MNREESNNSNQDYLSIDLIEFGKLIWRGKVILAAAILASVAISIVYLLSQPSVYRVEAVLALAETQEVRSATSSLLNQVGAIRAIGGLRSFGTAADPRGQSLAILRSRAFINSFLKEHNLIPSVLAGISGNSPRSSAIDSTLYDETNENWLIDFEGGQGNNPSDWQIYSRFKEVLEVVQDVETGLITIRIDWYDPFRAKQWLSWMISDINDHMRQADLQEAEESIDFLQNQISKTQLIEMRNVFYNLIESQTQVVMLADVRDGYAFRVIDPPIIFDDRVRPNRSVILLIGLVLGSIFGVLLLLIIHAMKFGISVTKPD